jgi:hypothetical protein
MGLLRVIREHDFGRIADWPRETLQLLRRGWRDRDLHNMRQKLNDAGSYHQGMLKLTTREYRALMALNRGQQDPAAALIVWQEEHGIRSVTRKFKN